MSDFSPLGDESDDIAAWADRLSPEGAPGVMSQRMREYLGDEGYEKLSAQNDTLAALHIQRQTLHNTVLSLATAYGTILGFIATVGAAALVVKFIF